MTPAAYEGAGQARADRAAGLRHPMNAVGFASVGLFSACAREATLIGAERGLAFDLARYHAVTTPRVSDRLLASQSVAYRNRPSPYRTNSSDGNGWRFR